MELGKEIFRTKAPASKLVHYIVLGLLAVSAVLATLFITIPCLKDSPTWISRLGGPLSVYLLIWLFWQITLDSLELSRRGCLLFCYHGIRCITEEETSDFRYSDIVTISLSETLPDMDRSRRGIALGLLTGNAFRIGAAMAAEKAHFYVHVQLPDRAETIVNAPDLRSWLKLDEVLSEMLPGYQRASRLKIRRT